MWPLLVALQLQVPAPIGSVNDFAEIIRPEIAARMTRLIDSVRAQSRGEIAVVTLKDLGGRPSMEVAVRIGREWGVGARGDAGDPARNAGVVVLLKPGARPGDGRSEIAIATGRGVEGFITDAVAGRVRDAIGRTAVASGRYDEGLLAGVELLAQAYAQGLQGARSAPARAPVPSRRPAPVVLVIVVVVVVATALFALVLVLSEWQTAAAEHRSDVPWWFGGSDLSGGTGGGKGSGGSTDWSWLGGGFGGGGGFSGGGASGSF